MLVELQQRQAILQLSFLILIQLFLSYPYPDGYPTAWTKFEIVISGLPNGTIPQKHRVGFRYYVKDGGPDGAVSDEIGIDDFDFISQ